MDDRPAHDAPALSVITPVRPGGEPFLEDAWLSLRDQSVPGDWEWLLQEDAAAPSSLLQQFARRDSRIRLAAGGADQGPSATRNLALGRARAALVRNLDSDDVLPAGCLEAGVELMNVDDSIGYAVGPALDRLPDGSDVTMAGDLPAGRIEPGVLFDCWTERGEVNAVHPAALMARRDLLLALGGWAALPAGGDTALLLAMSQLVAGWQLEQPVLIYRKHDAQFSRTAAATDAGSRAQRHALVRARAESMATLLGPAGQRWQ